MTSIPQILDKAADLLAKRGHCKHQYEETDGRLCLFGALNIAADCGPNGRTPKLLGALDDATQARSAIEKWIARNERPRPVGALAGWNDAPERTKEQIIAAFRECAAELRAGA